MMRFFRMIAIALAVAPLCAPADMPQVKCPRDCFTAIW